MYYIFFIHSSVDGCLCCSHVLGIINDAAMNIKVHISFQSMVFFRYMFRSGIADHMVVLFLVFLRKLHSVLHTGCTSLPTHQQCRRVSFFPHLLHHLSFIVFDDGLSNQCEMVSHCSLDLCFSSS